MNVFLLQVYKDDSFYRELFYTKSLKRRCPREPRWLFSHVNIEFCIVDVQILILIPYESPMQMVFCCIRFKGPEFVFYLWIDVLSLPCFHRPWFR